MPMIIAVLWMTRTDSAAYSQKKVITCNTIKGNILSNNVGKDCIRLVDY